MEIKKFVYEVFKHFDKLESTDVLLGYLSPDIVFNTPDGTLKGHAGFSKWYEEIKKDLISPTVHNVNFLKEEKLESNLFKAVFEVEFIAKTKTGNEINTKASESWLIEQNDNKLLIKEYSILAEEGSK